MKIPFSGSKAASRKKRTNDATEPSRVLIGTTNGTRKDAESLARSQIDRYFDSPDQSWLFVTEQPGGGHHFEIHQGGDGRPYLPSLMALELEPDDTVVIRAEGKTVVEVMLRTDSTFQSLVLPESQSEGLETDPRVTRPARKKMKPYATSGSEWIKVGVAVLSLGLLTVTVAGVIHKSFSIAMAGYHEIVETLPTSRLIRLSGGNQPSRYMHDLSSLPLKQWGRVENTLLLPGERIDRLILSDGRWEVVVSQTSKDVQDSSEGNEESPGESSVPGENVADADLSEHGQKAYLGDQDNVISEPSIGSEEPDAEYPTAHETAHIGGDE